MLREQAVCQVGEGHGADVLVVVDSQVVGVSKPDPRIWGFALEVLGVPAARTLYVGDSVYNDVEGARAAGLHPLHLDPYDDHPDATHDRIRSLSEVAAWQPGSTLVLDRRQDDPIDVFCQGLMVCRAAIAAKDERIVLRVEDCVIEKGWPGDVTPPVPEAPKENP